MSFKKETCFWVALFQSVSHVMKAEKKLISESIPIKIIPVPKSISSDCGVCIRFSYDIIDKIKQVLDRDFEEVKYRSI